VGMSNSKASTNIYNHTLAQQPILNDRAKFKRIRILLAGMFRCRFRNLAGWKRENERNLGSLKQKGTWERSSWFTGTSLK